MTCDLATEVFMVHASGKSVKFNPPEIRCTKFTTHLF